MGANMAFAEFGPETWTTTNWIGAGLWVVAVLFLLVIGWRLARPRIGDEAEGGGDEL